MIEKVDLGIIIIFVVVGAGFAILIYHQSEIDKPIKLAILQAIEERDCEKYEEYLIDYGNYLNYKFVLTQGQKFYELRCNK